MARHMVFSWLLLVSPAVVVEAAGSLEIVPRGIDCAVSDRFPRIEAVVTPADQVSLARVLFRTKTSEGWYWVRMDRESDRFVAVLPKPTRGLKDFHYYIEASDREFEMTQTPEFVPQVVANPVACSDKMVANTVGSAKVIVHVPAGYKVSPVPEGFSVRGALRAGEERLGVFPHMSLTTALVGAGALGAGAVVVGLSVANPKSPQGVPGTLTPAPLRGSVTLLASSPPPGSTISLNSGSLALSVRVAPDQDVTPGRVNVELRYFPGNLLCVTFSSPHAGFRQGTSQDITVSGHLNNASGCHLPFTTNDLCVSIANSQEAGFGRCFPLSYNFVP